MNSPDKENSKKTIRTFALASFLNDFGSDMIYPVWPIFVRNVLGANMAVLGFIDGLGDAVVSISKAVAGYVSDRIHKRKMFVWQGYLLGALSRIGYALTTSWPMLIPFRVLDRAGKIRSAPRDAIVAELSTSHDRGRNFGLLRAMDNLGAVCGILFCLLMLGTLGYRKLFMVASIPSVIAVLLIFFAIREAPPEKKIYKGISLKMLNKNLLLFFVLNSVFALGAFSYSFLLLYANEGGITLGFVPVLYLIYTAAAAFSSLPFGKLTDQIGRKKVLLISYLLWAFVCLGFVLFKSNGWTISGFILFGLHKGALEPSQKTLVSEMAPPEYKASTLGGFQMMIGLCALPASFMAGLLWDKMGKNSPFYLSAGLSLIAILMLFFVKDPFEEDRKAKKS